MARGRIVERDGHKHRRRRAARLQLRRARLCCAARSTSCCDQGAEAIVLDLRGNGGGLLSEAVLVSSIFIEDGEIVSVRGRAPLGAHAGRRGRRHRREDPRGHARGRRQRERVGDRDRRPARPQSARRSSARNTFGKGLVQEIEPLSNGGVARPDRRELLPAGRRDDLHEGHQAGDPGRGRPGHRSRRGAARGARRAASRAAMSAAVRGRPPGGSTSRWSPCWRSAAASWSREPLFGPGPADRGGARRRRRGRPRAGGLGQARRARAAPARPPRSRPRRGRGADARPRALPLAIPRAATRRGGARAPDDPYAADARVDLRELPTFTIDPDDAKDFDDAISARRENGRVRLWVHIADVTAYLRPGGRLEREAFRRGTSVYVPGAVEPMLPEVLSNRPARCGPGEDRLAVTVEMEMDGADVTSVAFHRSLVRSDRRLTYGEVDELFAGRARAEEPWGEPLAVARDVARALRERRDALEFGSPGAELRLRLRRAPDGRPLRGADRVAPPDRDADDPRERAGGRVPGGPEAADALPRARAARAAVGRVPGRAAGEPRHPDAAAAEADDPAAGGRRDQRRSRASWCASRAASARTACSCCAALKQAYYTPRNLGHAGLASPRYCHFTSPIRRYPDVVAHRALLQGLGIDQAAAPAHELEEAGVLSSASEREAMKIERDADDICLAFLLERALSGADPNASHTLRGRGGRADREGRVRRVRRAALRGPAAGAPAARLVDAERAGHRARGRGLGAPAAARRRGRGRGRPRRTPARPRGSDPRRGHTRRPMAKKRKRKAAAGDIATNRQASFRYNLLEQVRGRDRAPGLGGEVAAQRRRAAEGRLRRGAATARSGCATCTSRPTSPRARTTNPSARASCCCTGARSSG